MKKYKLALAALFLLGVIGSVLWYLFVADVAVLNSKGIIAHQQRDLIIFTTLLSLVIIVPVFVLTFVIVWKYREGNPKARYAPNWDGNRALELTWWGVPLLIILVLAVITYKTSHSLDPYRRLQSDRTPVNIQVIALPWKWLFIYPDENIATVNYVQFPENTPVNFQITADAPMNSFWIPELGGQVYAMSGMSTKLHLMADAPGKYKGSSANLSGEGFAGMQFMAESTTPAEYAKWLADTKSLSNYLSGGVYDALARPSKDNPPTRYSAVEVQLYDKVIDKYMKPKAVREEHTQSAPSDVTEHHKSQGHGTHQDH